MKISRKRALNYCRKLLGRRDGAEDLLQSALCWRAESKTNRALTLQWAIRRTFSAVYKRSKTEQNLRESVGETAIVAPNSGESFRQFQLRRENEEAQRTRAGKVVDCAAHSLRSAIAPQLKGQLLVDARLDLGENFGIVSALSQGKTKIEIADEIGISRPTLDKRIDALSAYFA